MAEAAEVSVLRHALFSHFSKILLPVILLDSIGFNAIVCIFTTCAITLFMMWNKVKWATKFNIKYDYEVYYLRKIFNRK